MPRQILMSWDAEQSRWTKMYRGRRYTVACGVLGTPATKGQSAEAANAWWIAKRAEIDGALKPEPTHNIALTNALDALPDAAAALFSDHQEQKDEALRAILEHYHTQRPTRQAQAEAKVAKVTAGMQRLMDEPGPDLERTVGAQFAAWSALVMASKKANVTKKMKIHRLGFFVEFLGKSSDASKIDENRWEGFFVWLCGKSLDDSYKARIWIDAKNFVHYLYEKRILDSLPRNLANTALAFGDTVKSIKVVAVGDVQYFYRACTGQTRLHVLLGLNCGMTAQDISDLQDSQVNWSEGTITRKRSKTADHEDVPQVCYQLWPDTFALLKEYRSGKETVLLTKSGLPWIQSEYSGEKYRHSDSIGSCFKNVCTKLSRKKRKESPKRKSVKVTPKNLRTLAATVLGTHPQYKFFAQYFLGQSPKTIADKHYVKPNDAEFFEALKWLRTQLLG